MANTVKLASKVVATMSDRLRSSKASLEMLEKSITDQLYGAEVGSDAQQQPSTSNQASTTTQKTETTYNQVTATAEQPGAVAMKPTQIPKPRLPQLPVTSTAAGPMTMEQRRTTSVGFLERKNPMSAADLIGADVYGTDNDLIGKSRM